MTIRLALASVALLLSGCVEAQKVAETPPAPAPQYDPRNPGPWCASAADAARHPWMPASDVIIILETMRQRGCMA